MWAGIGPVGWVLGRVGSEAGGGERWEERRGEGRLPNL